MTSGRVYLDSSAIVRLVLAEPGWESLVEFLRQHPLRVTSALSGTEVRRAVRRAEAGSERAVRSAAVLARIDQVTISSDLLRRAGDLEPSSLRTLNALHLATALELGPLTAFVTYDDRLADGARVHDLRVAAPG